MPRDCSCDFFEECSCLLPDLKSFLEAKVKSFGLMPFAEKISKESNIDTVLWLFVLILTKIHNEK